MRQYPSVNKQMMAVRMLDGLRLLNVFSLDVKQIILLMFNSVPGTNQY